MLKCQQLLTFKVTADTNNHNSCMTKHILLITSIFVKLTEINGIGMPDDLI